MNEESRPTRRLPNQNSTAVDRSVRRGQSVSRDVGSVILNDAVYFLRRFVVMDAVQVDALWTAHTHAAEAADTTPYLLVTSAEKRSGKTRLLDVLELLVHEPQPIANISDAALFRAIKELKPTLLLDEVDAIFGGKGEREDLRGLQRGIPPRRDFEGRFIRVRRSTQREPWS